MRHMESLRIEKKHTGYETNGTENSEFLTVEEAGRLEKDLQEKIKPIYEKLLEHPSILEALTILDTLPEHLRYHDKNHTLDVIHETILFAYADVADDTTIEQQAIAAAWHDVGFVQQDKENEIIAIQLFEKSESYKNLSEETRTEVIKNIQDTEVVLKEGVPLLLKQHSQYGYALDGDISNFGRKDFFERRKLVAEELKLDLDDIEVQKRFYRFAINLLKNHSWKTKSAYRLREAQRIQNLEHAEKEWGAINSQH